VRCSALARSAPVILLAIRPTAGFSRDEGILLSKPDYEYLAMLGLQANSPVLQHMSPKKLRGLHWIINDDRTRTDPIARADAVRAALAEVKGHQLWERMNPGHLWVGENHQNRGRSIPN
jgi:hypothetical protein